MTVFGGVLIYLALFGALAGLASLLKPVRFLGIRTRKRGLGVLGLGLLAFTAAVYLPVAETRVETARTHLDEFVPVGFWAAISAPLASTSLATCSRPGGYPGYRRNWRVDNPPQDSILPHMES
ncbi:MAG: hypothetical protein ABSC05_27870 [Candidatus Solibacter sp.]|jgi:hypothetical protein